jgi:hypothetical protein
MQAPADGGAHTLGAARDQYDPAFQARPCGRGDQGNLAQSEDVREPHDAAR